MKYIRLYTLLLFTLISSFHFLSAQSMQSLMKRPFGVVESKWEYNSQDDQELNYYNEDYCDYYLYRENDRSYNLRPGKNTIFSIKKGSQAENPFNRPTSYLFYRGQFPKDFQLEFPYALPVKNGEKTGWQTDPREPYKTMNFRIEKGDTVYATRSGIACKTTYPQHLLIYHIDRTFAAYVGMAQNFIKAGEEVCIGQPIGIADAKGVSISYFFLDRNKFNETPPSGHPHTHFVPVFRTSLGDVKMDEKKFYQSVIDDALMMQDMSKKEQKKYLKKK